MDGGGARSRPHPVPRCRAGHVGHRNRAGLALAEIAGELVGTTEPPAAASAIEHESRVIDGPQEEEASPCGPRSPAEASNDLDEVQGGSPIPVQAWHLHR